MIALVVAAHQELGPALLQAAEGIVGPMENVVALSLNYDEDPARARARMEDAIRRLDSGDGVLVMTDMFGGTPTNLSLPFLEPGRVDVVTGINLPMLLKAQSARGEMPLADLAGFLKDYGARNIIVAGEIWSARPRAAS
ncbi:MAG: PTS fructose transporter subunit IIA [Deltaproteobacteria bacterium]|nr:PTS fructose transporter subunit IIA [Deltaproteobacteria bacterium]